MTQVNKQITVASFPDAWVTESNFKLVESPMPSPKDGQVLVKNEWLSLDPYMRGRLSKSKSYAVGVEIGDVMVGGTVGTVIESKSSKFKVGDQVVGMLGWQLFGVANENEISKIDTSKVPSSAYLGVLGMPGVTAWTGLINICEPQAGETVVVDAASGAVGSVVGQLAKAKGCRVVGIAGGKDKCDYVVKELGFDACVDHRSSNFKEELKEALPKGIDCLFENVGGEIFENLLSKMNPFSRIALCGLVSEYNVEPHAYRNIRSILVNRIKIQGFIVSDKPATWPSIIQSLHDEVASGRLKFKETVANGIENAPSAFIGLLKGQNFGKQLVKLS
jgi:NADPH-dependent curcumin reductase CurA